MSRAAALVASLAVLSCGRRQVRRVPDAGAADPAEIFLRGQAHPRGGADTFSLEQAAADFERACGQALPLSPERAKVFRAEACRHGVSAACR